MCRLKLKLVNPYDWPSVPRHRAEGYLNGAKWQTPAITIEAVKLCRAGIGGMSGTGDDDDPIPVTKEVTEKEGMDDESEELYDPGRGYLDHRVKTPWWLWPKKMYYRYKLMTGVYMLGPGEETFLHFFFFLGAYFIVTYGIQFYTEMRSSGFIEQEGGGK